MKSVRSKGSAVFLVFIAIALFTALTYAVMRSGGGNASMGKEKANIAASEVMAYAQGIAQHVNRMMTVYGVSESDLDPGYTVKLGNGSTSANYKGNSNCSANKCRIFVDKNGKMQVQYFDKYAATRPTAWLVTDPLMGSVDFAVVNVTGVGTTAPDLAVRVRGMSFDVCNAIHRKLGLPEDTSAVESGTETQFYSAASATEMAGTTTNAEVVGSSNASFKGKTSFCAFLTDYANFYHVIVAR